MSFSKDWENWCRTCGKNNISEFEDDFVKWESIDEILLENIRKLTNLETLLKQDGIVCIDCHTFLKEMQKFSYSCIKINEMFTEIHLDYESFGESDLLTVRSRYDLDNEEMSSKQIRGRKNITNINDLLKIEIKQETNNENDGYEHESNDSTTVNDQMIISDGNRECKVNKKKRKVRHGGHRLPSKSIGEKSKRNKIIKLEEVNTEEGILNVNVDDTIMIKDDTEEVGIEDMLRDNHFDVLEEEEVVTVKKEMVKKKYKRIPKPKMPKITTCPICNLNFEKSQLYEAHLKANHVKDEWPIVCDKCSKRFTSTRGLRLHEIVHLPDSGKHEGPYVCEHCGKWCSSNSSLKEHLVVHSDEHPFECSCCTRRFKNLYRLKAHMKIHVGILFHCSTCGQQFNTQRTLNQHMVVHSEQKKYKCNYCGNEYKRAKTLKTHLILHTGQKPYKCPFCDRTFADGSNCRSHKKKAHPIELAAMEAAGEVHITNLPKLDHLQPK